MSSRPLAGAAQLNRGALGSNAMRFFSVILACAAIGCRQSPPAQVSGAPTARASIDSVKQDSLEVILRGYETKRINADAAAKAILDLNVQAGIEMDAPLRQAMVREVRARRPARGSLPNSR